MNKTRLLTALLFAGGLFALLVAIVAAYLFLVNRNLANRRELATPPSIFIHSPKSGDSAPAGSFVPARATVSGINPIARVELWLDGELFQTQSPEPAEAERATTFHASFDLQMTEGVHMLFWRAVDNAGLVGQSISIPLDIFALSVETTTITAEENQTLVDIALSQGAEMDALQQLNPGLGEGGLPGGTQVNVPVQPSGAASAQPPGGGAAPQPPVDIIEPEPLPVTPPGLPALVVAGFPAIDFSSVFGLDSAPPKAPSNFQAGWEPCKVRLQWSDNADNESHFKVWMQPQYGPPQVIATLQGSPATGLAWYEFASPALGAYSFWVEAVNSLGSQPSGIRWIVVRDPKCKEAIATRLEIVGLDMNVPGSYNPIHCYLSIEGTPFERIPEDEKQSIQVLGGSADIAAWLGNKNRILLPMPVDEEVTLQGECLGWQGSTLTSLGVFQASLPREKWDGSRQEIRTAGFIIGYLIRPFGSTQAAGSYAYTDTDIPTPYNLSVARKYSSDRLEDARLARTPTLFWDWEGDPSKITGFSIYLDGEFFRWAAPEYKWTTFRLPSACGGSYYIQVAANSGDARSKRSASVKYEQPPCPVMAEVQFLTVYAQMTDDTCTPPFMSTCKYSPCDMLNEYIWIFASSATSEERKREKADLVKGGFRCKVEYTFNQLGIEDKLVVAIDPLNPTLVFEAQLWDWDQVEDDRFALVGRKVPLPGENWPTYEDWPKYDETFTFNTPGNDTALVGTTIKVRVRGFYLQLP